MRVFVVQSEERLAYERAMREAAMEKPARLWRNSPGEWRRGRLKKVHNIGAAVARILSRNHGSRYFDWSLEQGVFRYFEHPVHLPAEKALKGKYVIQTEELDVRAVQVVEAYKELSEIERSFHRDAPHLPSAAQKGAGAYFRRSLGIPSGSGAGEETQSRGSADVQRPAFEALRTMHVVDIPVGAEIRRGVTAGNHQARQILAAFGISDRDPAPGSIFNARLVTN